MADYQSSDIRTKLGTGRQSSPLQIRQSYKKVSKLYHPDRNPSSDAQIKFQSIKSAYDILMDESQRVIYNKFGEQSINFDPRLDELKLLSEIAVVFVGWGVLSYIFTSPIGARACRTWVAILALVLLAIEITFTVMDTEIPKISNPLFQYLTEYELVLLSHSIYPLILSVLRVISEHYYVDIDTTLVEILKGIVGTQSAIAQLLNQLQQSLDEYIHNNNNHNTSTEELELKIKELKEVLDLSNNSSNYIINELKKSSNNLGSNYYWIIFVVMYGGIYLLQ
eukprot:gene17512-23073_t